MNKREEAIGYLEYVRDLHISIISTAEQIEHLTSMIDVCSSALSDRVASTKDDYNKTNNIIRLIEIKNDLKNDLDLYTQALQSAYEKIERIDNSIAKRMITLRYLEGLTFKEISERTSYSVGGVRHRLHRAIEYFISHYNT